MGKVRASYGFARISGMALIVFMVNYRLGLE